MKFTKYIWSLYKSSTAGQKDIHEISHGKIKKLARKFDFQYIFQFEDDDNKLSEVNFYKEISEDVGDRKLRSFDDARIFYAEFIEILRNDLSDREVMDWFVEYISVFTTSLYHYYPDYFFPYYFHKRDYIDFLLICENLNIQVPPVPGRNNYIKRVWHYFELCESMHRWRMEKGLESEDLPALIYGFGKKALESQKESELPKPSKVYFLGAGGGFKSEEDNWDFQFVDKADSSSRSTWGAGSLNIKKGDLVLMYCLSPRKYIHSLWRAKEDSFIDPFSYYYYAVNVGFPTHLKQICFKELKENDILKLNSVVRSNMQGLNGRPLSNEEYQEILRIQGSKGYDINKLIRLPIYDRVSASVENERDVELYLIEPFLKDIGIEESDWVRQLPLRMGRQTKYYPDYAIKVTTSKQGEKAKIILEAKYSISNEKQLFEAYLQARSYALRLQSRLIVIADRDCVYVYNYKNEEFETKPSIQFHWNELNNPDNVKVVKDVLKC